MSSHHYVKQIRSRIHNNGLHARSYIAAETRIIEYKGEHISHREADRRAEKDSGHCIYLFELNDKVIIDGDTDDNIAKYINHSCNPNCYAEIDGDQIWILASRDIQAGEELTYDYGFQRSGWHEHPCRCGEKECFGFIVARTHWNAIRKTQRYQKLMHQDA